MPRNYVATFADGTSHLIEDVPDDLHPNDALKRVEQAWPGNRVVQFTGQGRGFWGETKELAKDVVRGAGKAVASALEGAAAFNSVDRMNYTKPEDYTEASKVVEQTIPTPKNDGPGRGLIRAGLEGAGGAMTGPGVAAGPIRAALTGGMAGLGGEVAADVTGSEMARLPGAVAGGGVMGLLGAPKTTRGALVREVTKNLDDTDLASGQQFMANARQEGVDLNLSQAMRKPSDVDSMVETLANSRHGQGVVSGLRGQPDQVTAGINRKVGALPGQVQQPQVIANRAQEASDEAIRSGLKLASNAWMKHAPQGSAIPPQMIADLDKRLSALARQYPNTSGADLINDARQALVTGTTKPGPVGAGKITSTMSKGKPAPNYLTDALQLKGALEDALNTYGSRKLNTSGLDSTNLRRAQEVREAFRDVLGTHAPKLAAADAAYSDVMKTVVNPMKKSVVGRVAGVRGADDAVEAVQGKLFSLFDRGTIPGGGRSEILTLEKSMRKNDPGAFLDGGKTWLSKIVGEAVQRKGGRTSENTAANLESLIGSEVKRQGMKDVLVGMARAQGLPDETYVPGMMNMLKYISAAAKRPGRASGLSPDDLDQASRNKAIGGAGNFSLIAPFRQVFRNLDDALNADAYKFMDRLLTTPEGVATLRQLAKQPVMSKAAANTISTFLAAETSTPVQE